MWDLTIERIGGIRTGEVHLQEGTSVVQASNFQGKSSLVAAIRTVMGATGLDTDGGTHPLTEGARTGRVALATADDRFAVELERRGGPGTDVVVATGDPYLEDDRDRHVARLFAFLGEDNPVRAAVRSGDDDRLTELLQRPLDLEDIDRRIESLRREIAAREDDLREAEAAAAELPTVQEQVTDLEARLDQLQHEREDLAADVDEAAEAERLRERLSNEEATRESLQRERRQLAKTIDRKERRLADLQDELEALDVPDPDTIAADIEDLQERIADLDRELTLLEEVYSANTRVLHEEALALVTDVDRGLAGDDVTCWVCGDTTDVGAIETRLDALDERARTRREELEDLEATVEERQRRREAVQDKRDTRRELQQEIETLQVDLEEDRERLADRDTQLAELEEEIVTLQERYDAVKRSERHADEDLRRVEVQIGATENELASARDQLDTLREATDRRDRLQAQVDELRSDLEACKVRKETKLRELVDRFDDAIDEVLRTFGPGFDGGRLDRKRLGDGLTRFELVVARDGRETTVDRLSEGERELVGIAVAVAGYRTFDVAATVPCLLLDGIGQLAAEHIRNLIAYLEDAADVLVTTAYPEAGAFDDAAVVASDWELVTRDDAHPA